jgi:hypothetical protein
MRIWSQATRSGSASLILLWSAVALAGTCEATTAQVKVHPASGAWDTKDAPSANPLPGLRGAFREQLLLGAGRLGGVKGKKIVGIQFRRDYQDSSALKGGSVDLDVRLSSSTRPAAAALESFLFNAPSSKQMSVFVGAVTIPDSPAKGTSPAIWVANNSFTIRFSTKYPYAGGTLCVDIRGIPKKPGLPSFWYVDHEYKSSGGQGVVYGKSCSGFKPQGASLIATANGLQIGGSMRLLMFGRPGTSLLLLMGVKPIRVGADLSSMGAAGCRQYVDYLLMLNLQYQKAIPNMTPVLANFMGQIPPDQSLLGTSVFFQAADIETSLPRLTWTNPAGLTTSNGLEVKISTTAPSLDMAVVRSHEVAIGKPLPTTGRVDVERAPVVRILYTDK